MKNKILITLILFVFTSFASLTISQQQNPKNAEHEAQTQPQTQNAENPGNWQVFEIAIPKSPEGRMHSGQVWTGELFYTLSGWKNNDEKIVSEFWCYDPKIDIWIKLNYPKFLESRVGIKLFWTGKEILAYGGFTVESGDYFYYRSEPNLEKLFNDGAAYDVTTKKWRKISSENAPEPRIGYSAIWTGSEMIIYGGEDKKENILFNCKAYCPSTDKWRNIIITVGLKPRSYHSAVWTGKSMIITGGIVFYEKKKVYSGSTFWKTDENSEMNEEKQYRTETTEFTTNQAAIYYPKKNKWKLLELNDSRACHTSVWTGKEVVLWGGYSSNSDDSKWCHNAEIIRSNDNFNIKQDSNIWSVTEDNPRFAARKNHIAIWTGCEMLIGFGDDSVGCGNSMLYRSGGLFDPETRTWTLPRNCPFSIFDKDFYSQTFFDGKEVYNFFKYERGLTGKYNPSKDLFFPVLGTGFQPNSAETQFIDTPEGIFAVEKFGYMNWRISTYAFWKFDEKQGKFARIDDNRSQILYGDAYPLWRNDKVQFFTNYIGKIANYTSMNCKAGYLGIYDPKKNRWLNAQMDKNVPVDRFDNTQVFSKDYIFVFGGRFSPEMQFSEVFEGDWKNRLPSEYIGLREWQQPWFDEQKKIAMQSKNYPILDGGHLYNFKTNKWNKTACKNAPKSRIESISCEINGKFAVFGGKKGLYKSNGPSWGDEAVAELYRKDTLIDGGIYDPKTNSWVKIEPLTLEKYVMPKYGWENNSQHLISVGEKLLLHGDYEPYWKDEEAIKKFKEERGENVDPPSEFYKYPFGFIYDVENKKWAHLEPPRNDCLHIEKAMNVGNKTMLKIVIDDEYDDLAKWFIYDSTNNNWTDCEINNRLWKEHEGFVEADFYNESLPRVFNDKLIFYEQKTVKYEVDADREPKKIQILMIMKI